MSAPICQQCEKRPASKDGTRGGVQRYRSICGRCRWDQRMEDIRDERTALYQTAQQVATMRAEMIRLTADYDATLAHKWQWMERAEAAEARVKEQRDAMDDLERSAEAYADKVAILTKDVVERTQLLGAYVNQAVDMRAQIERLTDAVDAGKVDLARQCTAYVADMRQLDAALTSERQWSGRVTTALFAATLVLMLALSWSVLT